uniref:Uncharacterized protein n=1 Tax=Oryza punctata TaxID=4537 RepID=A0A0E0LGV5_ORYPU
MVSGSKPWFCIKESMLKLMCVGVSSDTLEFDIHCIIQKSLVPTMKHPIYQHQLIVLCSVVNRLSPTGDFKNKHAKGKYIGKGSCFASSC